MNQKLCHWCNDEKPLRMFPTYGNKCKPCRYKHDSKLVDFKKNREFNRAVRGAFG